MLADGTAIDAATLLGFSFYARYANITLTLMPKDFLAGDYNSDGKVNAADYTIWRDHMGQEADMLANNFHSGLVGHAEYQTWVENFGAEIAAPILLPGDYNDDGIVDAADYSVWRDNLNSPAGSLLNDPNRGIIGSAQYNTWVANFGYTLQSDPLASSSAIPEPSSLVLILLSIGILCRSERSLQ